MSLIILLFSIVTIGIATENNETINIRVGDQFTINSLEHSFEYDSNYISMVVNSNGTETFTALQTGNTTINHKVYPSGNTEKYNVSIRELTFIEYVSKIIDDFFNAFK
ncbi:MAG: hypothetical protein LBB45_01925 [Methanobrevibacter sp.]|nr:hypothetical protein [Candidatus Methanovirga basalitermitum]